MSTQLKGEQKMEQTQFNAFDYVKTNVLVGYFKSNMSKEFTFDIKNYFRNQGIINYLYQKKTLKVVGYEKEEIVNTDTGKLSIVYHVKVKDFDINAKAISKNNKEYNIFFDKEIGKAQRIAMKSKV